MNIKFSELKALRDIVGDEWRDTAIIISAGCIDTYYAMDYRVIASSDIDEIQQDELSDDEYILGCFMPHALSHATGIPQEAFEAMQEHEAFEAAGKTVLAIDGALEKLQEYYASCDGYGPHFSHYDFSEEEITLGGELYHVFRVN